MGGENGKFMKYLTIALARDGLLFSEMQVYKGKRKKQALEWRV